MLGSIGNRFRRDVRRYVDANGIPVLRLRTPDRTRWDDRKLDHVRPYLQAAERERRFGVVAIVACEEFQWVFSARNRSKTPGTVWFEFFRERRRVGAYYFYILDADRHLRGLTTLRTLILSRPDAKLADIMNRDTIAARIPANTSSSIIPRPPPSL